MSEIHGSVLVQNGLVLNLDASNPQSYDGNNTTWVDLSQYKNNGTIFNSPIYNTSNKGYFTFDGVTNYVNIPYNASLNFRNAITLSCFIKRGSNYTANGDTYILSRTPSWYFYDAYNTGCIRGDVYIDGVRKAALTTPIIPFDGLWYMITYTYDSSDGYARIYVNGVQTNSTQLTGLSNYLIDSTLIGFYPNIGSSGSSKILNLNNLMLYNICLSPSDVLNNYNSLKNRYL